MRRGRGRGFRLVLVVRGRHNGYLDGCLDGQGWADTRLDVCAGLDGTSLLLYRKVDGHTHWIYDLSRIAHDLRVVIDC